MFCDEVDDPEEREAVYALRYAVLVEEMGRPQRHADHAGRLLAEPVDADAIHLGAFVPAESATGRRRLVGALRIHVAGRSDLAFLAEIHPALMRRDGVRRGAVTRLVTAPEARGGGDDAAGLALAVAAYRVALRESLDVVHIDCHAGLRPFFTWLGFDLDRAFTHPDYGEIAVMSIRVEDRARLEKTRSPFLRVLDLERPPVESAAPGARGLAEARTAAR